MENSPHVILESFCLVTKLEARTEEDKILWQESACSSPDSEVLETELKDEVIVRVSSDSLLVSLKVLIKDKVAQERAILDLSLEHDPEFGYRAPVETPLYRKLIRVHELARRSVFKIDQNLANTRQYLASLAG
jgi:hypothetical protein